MACTKLILTKSEADIALKIISKKGRQHQKEKRNYYCYGCKGWHLTSKDDKNIVIKTQPVKLKHVDKWKSFLNQNTNEEVTVTN